MNTFLFSSFLYRNPFPYRIMISLVPKNSNPIISTRQIWKVHFILLDRLPNTLITILSTVLADLIFFLSPILTMIGKWELHNIMS